MYLFLAVPPVPASRPRVTRWGTFYAKTYETFRAAADAELAKMSGPPTPHPVVLGMEIVAKRPKAGKLVHPRGDVDNFAKGPMDAMTKAGKFWNDDNQVIELLVRKRYAEKGEPEGVHIVIGEKTA